MLGYGNPGRKDDGLGPALAEAIAEADLPELKADAAYQLTIEDAAEIAEHDVVLFIDAAAQGADPFFVRKVGPTGAVAFTSHVMTPQALLSVCRDVFKKTPTAWLVAVRGYHFGYGEGLSARASTNWREALFFVTLLIHQWKETVMNDAEQKTILIIDDDPDIRAATRMVLESAGFSVGEAATGEEGVKSAERAKPDAIIVDLMMETVDAGSRLSGHLQETGFDGPIYLLSSAGDSVRYNLDTRKLGLAGVFQKPVDPHILLSTMKSKLGVN